MLCSMCNKSSWTRKKSEKTGRTSGQEAAKWTSDGKPVCSRCGGKGHKEAQCATPATVSVVRLMANCVACDESNFILLDDGAEMSVFCSADLLENESKPGKQPKLMSAARDGTMDAEGYGYFLGVEVLVSNSVVYNILSREDTAAQFRLYALDGWGTRAVNKLTGQIIDFCLEGNQAYIYGAMEAQLKGRTVWQQPRVMNRDGAAPLVTKRDVKPYVDPMMLLEHHFPVGVVKPLSLRMIVHVKSLTAANLKKDIAAMQNSYAAFRL